MTRSIVFRRAAQAEYAEAARWYEERAFGVGYRFVEHVEQSLSAVAEAPFRSAVLFAGIRRVKIRGFPFFGYYVVDETRIVILAILHARRDPSAWRGRT